MQKYIRPISLVAFLTLFLGALFSLAGVGTSLFYVGIVASFLLLFFILVFVAFSFMKNSSAIQKTMVSAYLLSILITFSGLIIRFAMSNAPNYKFRHYMDIGFNIFFGGLVFLGILVIGNLLYIAIFTKESDFVKQK